MSEYWRKMGVIISVMTGCTVATIAYASGMHGIAFSIINRIWNIFISIAFTTGVILMGTSLMQLIQAMKDEDAENKTKAIRHIVVSVCLLQFQILLDPVLGALGFFR